MLDGLNECDDQSRQWLVRKFDELFSANLEQSEKSNAKVILVSQELNVLEGLNSRGRCSRIRLEEPENETHIQKDIDRVVKGKASRIPMDLKVPRAIRTR